MSIEPDCTSSNICTDDENVPPSLYCISTWPLANVFTRSTKYLSGRHKVIEFGHEVSKTILAGDAGFSISAACATLTGVPATRAADPTIAAPTATAMAFLRANALTP